MSNNLNLFSDDSYVKALTNANGTINSLNFPFPYPDEMDCLWIIMLEKISKIKIQVLALDLSPYYDGGDESTNYLKITSCGDSQIFFGGEKYELPIEIEGKCISAKVVLKTGENENRNYGFLLKYYSYENPNILIVSNESAKAVTLNTKGMYVKYVVAIISLQNSLHKNYIIVCISEIFQ